MERKGLHLAIIPDGNRRWARSNGLLPWNGHEKAVANFRSITEWCRNDPRVSILTVWCFSTENWKRDPEEIKKLMGLLEEYLSSEREDLVRKKTRFLHSGRSDRIPKSLSKLLYDVSEETKDHTDFTLNLAVDYGGKDEILRALGKMINDCTRRGKACLAPTEQNIHLYLDHPDLTDIDLIIRTSGEMRTSNFFLWQSAYSEWFFLEKHFPDLRVTDLDSALTEYETRKRRFGG